MLPSFYNSPKTKPEKFDGIKIFPESSMRAKEVIKRALEINESVIEQSPPDNPC